MTVTAGGGEAGREAGVKRLNWGCGGYPTEGWVNSDKGSYVGVQLVCDILEGLPLEDDSIDYAASNHALNEIAYKDLVPVLKELRRVLKPGGVLRLCLPDLDRNIQAYLDKDRDYFLVPDDDAGTISGKFITQIIWYGWSRSLFTHEFMDELLGKAEFTRVDHCEFGRTASPFPGIVELDDRKRESLFVEAVK